MKLSLIGMSGAGKTYWSKKLEKEGFIRFGCDDSIEKKLGGVLKKLGYQGINDVSKWMGQPYNVQYAETSKKYLDMEKESMQEILSEFASINQNIVIDTTGSVIYTGNAILKKLKKLTTVVYLDTPVSVKKKMIELYVKDPKPVIWGSAFNQKKGEAPLEALSRCYPNLLSFRTKQYKKLADITIDYFSLRKPSQSSAFFQSLIN